jgi:hypothetical protein
VAASGPQLPLPVQSGLCFDIAQRGHHQRHRDRRCGVGARWPTARHPAGARALQRAGTPTADRSSSCCRCAGDDAGSARGRHWPASPARSPGGSSSSDRSRCSRGCPGRRCSPSSGRSCPHRSRTRWCRPGRCRGRATAARPAVSVRRAPRVKVLAAAWGRAAGTSTPARTTSRASGRFAWHLGTWCGELDIGALSTGAVGVEPVRSMGSPGSYEPGRRQVNDVLRPTAAGDHPPDVAAVRGSPWIPCAVSISASVTGGHSPTARPRGT